MDDETRRYRLSRAKEVLRDIHHIPVATVNEDGSPLSSPVFMAFDGLLHGFWSSSPESMHSKNIARDPRIFLAIFDSKEGHSGLFLSGKATVLNEPGPILAALERLAKLKGSLYGGMGDVGHYIEGPQRIYEFIPEKAWVNHSEKEGSVVVRDQRFEIPLSDLLTS